MDSKKEIKTLTLVREAVRSLRVASRVRTGDSLTTPTGGKGNGSVHGGSTRTA